MECSYLRDRCMLCGDVKDFNEQYKLHRHDYGVSTTTVTRRMDSKKTGNIRVDKVRSLNEILWNPTC